MSNPKMDDHSWYGTLNSLNMPDRSFLRFDIYHGEESPIKFDHKYSANLKGLITMCSGTTCHFEQAFPNSPSPVGYVYYTQAIRDDPGEHWNVDHRLHWTCSKGNIWYLQFRDVPSHVQPYFDESGFSTFAKWEGWPKKKYGYFDELY